MVAALGGLHPECSTSVNLTVPVPLEYGGSHFDWKLAVDYKLLDATMIYAMASTGFRSEGAQPRPFIPDQLLPVPGEEITAYEIGMKSDFFEHRLRTNLALFLNDYDPRVTTRFGEQCNPPRRAHRSLVPVRLLSCGHTAGRQLRNSVDQLLRGSRQGQGRRA